MTKRPPVSTRTDSLFPYPALFRSLAADVQSVHGRAGLHFSGGADRRSPHPDAGEQAFGDHPRLGADMADRLRGRRQGADDRSEEHTSEHQSPMRISYAVFCLKKQHKLTIPLTNTPVYYMHHP